MAATKIKVESGMQLLARLSKKSGIEKFYPILFESGPKHGDVIELYSAGSTNCLLMELICESLIPHNLNGPEAGVIIFNTDGNLDFDSLLKLLKNKIVQRLENSKSDASIGYTDSLLQSILSNLYFMDIFDVNQFYISIQNLEILLTKYPNTSLVVFNTLTAFYWCEQDAKIMKMDLYLKKLLHIVQRVIKDYKVTMLYTRPEYFSSSKEKIEHLEPCYSDSKEEQLNYRIQIVYNNDVNHINIRTFSKQLQKQFHLFNDEIIWL